MKKNMFISIIVETLFVATCILLIIFCMPTQIPMHINIYHQIDSLFSKWFFLVAPIFSIIFLIFYFCSKQKASKKLSKLFWFLTIFESLLAGLYYSIEFSFAIGDHFKIPLGVIAGLPLSIYFMTWANLLKNIPYKSKLGIKSKYALETEFLWTQIHYDAKDKFFAAGFFMMIISLIFCIFENSLLLLLAIILDLIITSIFVQKSAKEQYNKYIEMKNRRDKQQQKEKEKNTTN